MWDNIRGYMWSNIGEKLQKFAKALCWIGIAFSVIVGVIKLADGDLLYGFLYIIIGSLGSWIGSWALCGFGLIVEYVENKTSHSNYRSSDTASESMEVDSGSYWVCPKCKTRNPNSKIECKECGEINPKPSV